jgi:hypothetical protein
MQISNSFFCFLRPSLEFFSRSLEKIPLRMYDPTDIFHMWLIESVFVAVTLNRQYRHIYLQLI